MNPTNNAYDVVYAPIDTGEPQVANEVQPLTPTQRVAPPVSDMIARALQGTSQNAQTFVDAVTANAGAEAANTAANALRRQRSGKSGFADLAAVVQQGVNIAYETRTRSEMARNEQEAKIAETLRKAKVDDANIDFEIEQQALRAEAPDLLRSPGGNAGYTRRIQELLTAYRDTADPETYIRVTGELFAPLQEYNRDLSNAVRGTVQESADSNRAVAERQFSVAYEGRFQQLAYAATPDEQTRISNEIIANIGTDTANMSPFDRARVTGALMTSLSENYGVSSARFAGTNAALSDINGYSTDIAAALETYEADRNLSNFRFNENRIAAQYPNLPANARYESPDQDLQHALSVQQLQTDTREAQNEALLSAGEAIQIGNDTVADLAYTIYSDPASQPLYDAVLGNNPEYKQAIAVAELLRTQQTVNTEANASIQKHQLTIQNLSTQNVEQTLSWANSQNAAERDKYRNTVQNLLTLPGVSADVKAAAQQYITAESSGQPVPQAYIDQLNQGIINSREQSITIVNSQIALESERIRAATAMLRPYGLDTADGVTQQMSNSQQTLGTLRTRINEARTTTAANQGRQNIPGARGGGAVDPNFRMPRLSTATVGNVTAALPFAENTDTPLTGGDGLYNQYRDYYNDGQGGHHKGMDVAVAAGTPIVMYTHGVVTFAGELGEYGNYVEIKSADGYVHRFAHLSGYSVQVGDDVMAGQTFAQSGGTPGAAGAGRSTGAHLHWEVRLPSPNAGGGEPMNPLEYTSALQQAVSRRPRNGQESRQSGTQLGAGQTLSSSRGAGYSTSNPLQQRYASVRSADYQRSPDGSANYGYAALANDRSFRLGLHNAAKTMNVPTQWLADVMGYETGGAFGSAVANARTGATGIIQFIPATLAAYGETTESFGRMTNTQQLSLTVRYLEDVRQEAGLDRWRSPYDVLMAVWGGGNALYEFIQDPESVRNYSDGDITWIEYTQKLGSNAGRRYTPIYDAPVQHTSFVQGCTMCVALLEGGNELYAHTIAAGDIA